MHYARSEAKAYGRKHMRGIWAAIPFPFNAKGELDEAGLRRDLRQYIDELKIEGLFCGGLVGEYWTLTLEERKRGQQIIVEEVADKIPTMPHTGAMSLRDTIALTQHAQKIGATFVVIGNPPVSTHDAEELYQFYRAICAEADIGISLFNTPICGYSLAPQLVGRIADLPNIFAIKNPLPVEHTDEVRKAVADKIIVCDPNEGRWLDNIIKHKDPVYMSSPDPYLMQTPGKLTMREYTLKAQAGDIAGARAISATLDPVRRVADEWMNNKWKEPSVPVAVFKYWSELVGLTGGNPRAPTRPLSDEQKSRLKRELEAVGLLRK
jgi:4-hydroxy-tetrahydrodipicolinate synthase